MVNETDTGGQLWLVGAGPGDPELLTVKAVRLVQAADVVVHDEAVDARIVGMARADADILIADGPTPSVPSRLALRMHIVRQVRAGKTVVRLKNGDPFMFSRGGEFLEAARAEGLSCTVVPGVSAAHGCAAEAGLPLTCRGLADAVTFVAGTDANLAAQDWRGLAGAGRTLVVYMGVETAGQVAARLMADGVSPDMPVAVIERGTLPGARAIRTLVAELGSMVREQGVRNPAVLVVGRVAGLAEAEDVLVSAAARALAEAQLR